MAPSARSCIALLTVSALTLLGFSPLWSQEGEDTPLAIGFVDLDGKTEFVEFAGQAENQREVTPSGIPSEPPGHELVRLTNQERASRGISPLKAASELMDAAQFHSDWMADHDCAAHNCPGEPDWITRIEDAGYINYTALAENVAFGYTTAASAIDGWMDSSGHRANMLNASLREAGGGYAYNSSAYYRHYWTIDFGARDTCAESDCPPVHPIIINAEAWSTSSSEVDIYVYGGGWASQMRFSNDGVNWSDWEPFSANTSWTLSYGSGSPATVHCQIRNGSTVLENSDEIHIEIPLDVHPDSMMFLSDQGTAPTLPASYPLTISCPESWTASADEDWIRLSPDSGSGSTTASAYLQDFPDTPGTHTGAITVTSGSEEQVVQVTLVVTNEPVERGFVPLVLKDD